MEYLGEMNEISYSTKSTVEEYLKQNTLRHENILQPVGYYRQGFPGHGPCHMGQDNQLYGPGDPHREQIYEAHDAVNYLIIVFPLCDMNLLEFKERGLMTEDKARDHRTLRR